MENLYIVVDGYLYEFEVIDELLGMGYDIFFIINLKFIYKYFIFNIIFCLFI